MPLKKKKKLEIRGGPTCQVMFKYEDLPTLCFICGVLEHSERFCEKLFDVPKEQIVHEYSLDLKAAPRRRNYVDGSRWLKSGLAVKNRMDDCLEASSSNGGRWSNLVPPVTGSQQRMIANNQGSPLLHLDSRDTNGEPVMRTVDNVNGAQINMEKSLTLGKVNEHVIMAPTEIDLNSGLTFIDNKRRRMGIEKEVGRNDTQVLELGHGISNHSQGVKNMDISNSEDNDVAAQNEVSKNLIEAGAGFQVRQVL
uniref:Zinc knuckle CX2CX4HX4C domain-containing protein n=1 Tax=Cannabis sativa TaxID=3483 RepID=A0A803PA13_CANSA